MPLLIKDEDIACICMPSPPKGQDIACMHMHHPVPSAHFTQIWIWILKWIAMRKRGRNSLWVCWIADLISNLAEPFDCWLHEQLQEQQQRTGCSPAVCIIHYIFKEGFGCWCSQVEEVFTFLIYTHSSHMNSWNEWNAEIFVI